MKDTNHLPIVLLLILLAFPFDLYAKDQLTLNILTDINKKHPENVHVVTSLEGKSLYFVYGYVKIVSDIPNIESVTYLFEWAYDDGTGEIPLCSYKSGNNSMEYSRKLDRIIDYYWVKKSIYGDKPGRYMFRVFKKGKSKILKKAETYIIVGR